MSRVSIPVPEYRDVSWMEKAKCRNIPHADAMRIFFPEKGQQWKEAKNICLGCKPTASKKGEAACPVREECLDYALSFEPDGLVGVWGGTTASERHKMVAPPKPRKPPESRSYRNLDRLGELLDLVASVHREADNVQP